MAAAGVGERRGVLSQFDAKIPVVEQLTTFSI
jgi:hypothetical protein